MLDLWLEFEAAETADAEFAKSMDRVLPVFQNMKTTEEAGSVTVLQGRKLRSVMLT